MRLIDCHAHYDDDRFSSVYPGGTEQALLDAKRAGILNIINIGADIATSEASVRLAEQYDFVYAAVGIHPQDAQKVTVSINEALDRVRALAKHKKVVAIGEIGLDYHYDDTDKETQKRYFDAQLSLAEELNLPVEIHDRDAHGDSFDIVRAHPNVRGEFHSYSGSPEMAVQLVERGWYIAFSGPITYKNSGKLWNVARAVPAERILTETDAPYLPPTPYRGQINHSSYLPLVLNAVAAARGEDPEILAEQTVRNAKTLYSI